MAIWIDVKTAVPAVGYLCLICCEHNDSHTGNRYKIAKYKARTASSWALKKWYSCEAPYEEIKDVTHWMPCPAGPELSEVADLESLTWQYDGLPVETPQEAIELTVDPLNFYDILKGDENNG